MRTPKNNTPVLVAQLCTQAEVALLDLVRDNTAKELVTSLRSVHDLALYNSTINIRQQEKDELLLVKLLADAILKIGEEENN
jgi:hypothetical protein